VSWKDTYQTWLDRKDLEPSLKRQLAAMKDEKEIEDAFYGPLSFGTAGMRGLMGPGINRMNVYTVRQATEGLAQFMDTLGMKSSSAGLLLATIPVIIHACLPMMLLVSWEPTISRSTSMTICGRPQSCHLPFATSILMPAL
jgi:Phosphomannomutase